MGCSEGSEGPQKREAAEGRTESAENGEGVGRAGGGDGAEAAAIAGQRRLSAGSVGPAAAGGGGLNAGRPCVDAFRGAAQASGVKAREAKKRRRLEDNEDTSRGGQESVQVRHL